MAMMKAATDVMRVPDKEKGIADDGAECIRQWKQRWQKTMAGDIGGGAPVGMRSDFRAQDAAVAEVKGEDTDGGAAEAADGWAAGAADGRAAGAAGNSLYTPRMEYIRSALRRILDSDMQNCIDAWQKLYEAEQKEKCLQCDEQEGLCINEMCDIDGHCEMKGCECAGSASVFWEKWCVAQSCAMVAMEQQYGMERKTVRRFDVWGYSSGHPMPGFLLSEVLFSLDLVNLVYNNRN